MNFIQRMFGRHPQEDSAQSTPSCSWPGQSGRNYQYDIYSLDADFRPLAGNYIYARQTEEGWVPVYVSQTRDLHQRLEGSVRTADAIANGATHLHAHYCSTSQAVRCSEERDLIDRWHPICNEVVAN